MNGFVLGWVTGLITLCAGLVVTGHFALMIAFLQ